MKNYKKMKMDDKVVVKIKVDCYNIVMNRTLEAYMIVMEEIQSLVGKDRDYKVVMKRIEV